MRTTKERFWRLNVTVDPDRAFRWWPESFHLYVFKRDSRRYRKIAALNQ